MKNRVLIRNDTAVSIKILSGMLGGIFIGVLCVNSLSAGSPRAISAVKTAHTSAPLWTRFHGPMGLGVVENGSLPSTWAPDDYAWTVQLSGQDVGSPVTDGKRVYLLDSKIDEREDGAAHPSGTIDLIALELASGHERWRRSHRVTTRKQHPRNSPVSTTPVIDGERVFVVIAGADELSLYAYSRDGQPLWQRQLGSWSGTHGFGTSPTVIGGQLILFNSQQADQLDPSQTAGQSRMMAFDLDTGNDLWSTPLETTNPCYGVPALYRGASGAGEGVVNDRSQIIGANKGNGLFGLALHSGEMLWSLDVFNKRCCSSPLVIGNLVIGTCGSGGGGNVLSAVRIPTQPGEDAEEVFRISSGAPYVPTSVVKDGLLFTISDAGIASCFDIQDEGRKLWSQRMGGNFGASPIIVGEQLLMISLDGAAHVTTASRDRDHVSEFDLGGRVGATPAYTSGRLLLRVGTKLHCLETP